MKTETRCVALVAPPANMHIAGWTGQSITHVQLLHATHLGRHSRTFIGENLGLHLAAASLEAAGLRAAVFDACLREWDVEDLASRVDAFQPDCICIYTLDGVLDEVRIIVERLAHLRAMTIAVGPAAINAGDELERFLGVDLVWRGDAQGFGKWLQGQGPANATAPFCAHPTPLRADSAEAISKRFTLGIASSRGCSYGRCGFCTIAANSRRQSLCWEPRTAESVVSEFLAVRSSFSPSWITFADADFVGDHELGRSRALKIADLLVQQGNATPFMFDCRLDQLDEELLLRLRAAGLRQVFVGIEHDSSHARAALSKGLSTDRIQTTLGLLRKHEIQFIPGYIVFLPWEAPEETLASFRYFRSLGYYDLWRGTSVLRPYGGTALARRSRSRLAWQEQFERSFSSFLRRALIRIVELDTAERHVPTEAISRLSACHFDAVEDLLRLFTEGKTLPSADDCDAIVDEATARFDTMLNDIDLGTRSPTAT